MNYNIEGNIFLNAVINITEFGNENGCTVTFIISGSKGSDESASLTVNNEVPPPDRTDKSIYIWTLEQLKKYEIKK